ncbi:hypothetical protein M9H77_33313 [Catharanthus roseus]|uniref:Uncharacterized protein n=1 Tax=Catharanthus roseus TaxID=4058 RepID=A0ACB9ZIV3_CATRO|nr:hypothetical protein M9H77_33313 [Catharanthus roseus]
MAGSEETKLQNFLQWLEVNGVKLRGCEIKYCDSNKGFGIYTRNDVPDDGVLLVVPMDLAITPMRVSQDPILGPECRALFDGGIVDDRFFMFVFLMVERLRPNSSWKPYLDMLPTTFGNPLWFSDEELLELKGTALYRAIELQKKSLLSLYNEKVKKLAEKLLTLHGYLEREVTFDDFLWAHSIFWTRAQNIPLPHSYVLPAVQGEKDVAISSSSRESGLNVSQVSYMNGTQGQVAGVPHISQEEGTIWVEGLVPGIDFCNHDLKALATWEVDGTGSITGVPVSMYLLHAGTKLFEGEKEISISYGNKGNEELLYLYGFVINDNPDDYLMINYPAEAIQNIAFSEQKAQLLEAQKAELRCLLPRGLLNHGFFPPCPPEEEKCKDSNTSSRVSNFSWSGQRKIPSYINKLVFPEDFLTALRTLAMKEDELYQAASLLEELVGPEGQRQPSDTEVRAAIWEVCGDSGALQLLVDLLNMKMMALEDGTGTEESDNNLLKAASYDEIPQDLTRNRWSCIVYRRGQKQLTELFLKEAEHALQLALEETN